ncbi:hypothetical protein NUU61_001993 [Penicillium alfredii]|uniref:DHHA2 domain-containing protein n=1 Tax=Penicillium alfredii TaxID=1506179 RepID=A0A9W9FQN0_9EURO|nr:uncharacterized protein NUU61_001993 [Penicillium alfredii]KAJ5104646.1 hypothetical protein NUU61_001993 [Penicillium alfredii]
MSLLQFLRHTRQVHLQFLSGVRTESPIYVVGNPSADLDSIVSAIVYSYCADNRLPTTTPRPHVPVLNLPNVPAGPELFRLRPEFVTALWLSTNCPPTRSDECFENTSDSAGTLLREHLVTVADFAQGLKDRKGSSKLVADATMVDWNAMPYRADSEPGQGSLSGLSDVAFRTLGCIDHHVDEHFVPRADALPADQPLIVKPGPGSCASLITNELERRGLWKRDAASTADIAQVAKLALSAVLIDTSNLTAEGKVTETDVHAVDFLRRQIESRSPDTATPSPGSTGDLTAFYEQILNTKQNSLDLLTLDEVLGRDFKDWTETARSSGESIKLGFCSSVKPMQWIVQKAGGPQSFLDAVHSFAAAEDKQLDVVIVMTAFTSAAEAPFCRELFVCATRKAGSAIAGAEAFVAQAASQLGLVDWTPLDGAVERTDPDLHSTLNGNSPVWRRLWVQTNVSASRKQVAPLLRTAMAKL